MQNHFGGELDDLSCPFHQAFTDDDGDNDDDNNGDNDDNDDNDVNDDDDNVVFMLLSF